MAAAAILKIRKIAISQRYLLIFCNFYTEMLAVIAVSAELTAIMLKKICKILKFMCHFLNSVHNGQLCAKFCEHRILTSLIVLIMHWNRQPDAKGREKVFFGIWCR